MMAVILRIILLLAPMLLLVMWLRWRMKKDRSEEELDTELFRLRLGLGILAGVALAAGIGLRIMDDDGGGPRMKYIPPHTVDGVVVPGRYVPEDGDEDKTGGSGPDDGGSDDGSAGDDESGGPD